MKIFNVAVVGCGNVSNMHFSAYAAHPERIKLVAAFDPVQERVDEVKEKYGVKQGYTDLQQMIDNADFEVAVICTPTSVRSDTIATLAEAKKRIYTEKPLADTLGEARKTVEACEKYGVQLGVNQNFRYHYPFETGREIIESGAIGKVLTILQEDLMHRQDRGWRTEMPRNALSVMGIHWFDGFRWLLSSDPQHLMAETYSSPAVECVGETDATVHILFEQGSSVSYIQSFSSRLKRTQTLIIGESGTLLLDYNGAYLLGEDGEPSQSWENPYKGKDKPKATFTGISEFFRAIEQNGTPANGGRDNLKVVALLEAAYRSAEEHSVVRFKGGLPE